MFLNLTFDDGIVSVRKVIPVEQGLRLLFVFMSVIILVVVRKVIPVEQGLRQRFAAC